VAKRMRRLRAVQVWDRVGQRYMLVEQSGFKGHYGKELKDRRRRGYLAKLARRKNRGK